MSEVNYKREVDSTMDQAIQKITQALQAEGFGVLTRIDFHTKLKEKINAIIPPLVILGACSPKMAYEAFIRNADVTSLLPCNVVIREVAAGKVSVEVVKPTELMKVLNDPELVSLSKTADQQLERALLSL